MATDKVYQYLTAFLAGEMRKSYPKFDVGLGYGAKDSRPNKGKVAHLCELIENSVFGKRVAYVDADGCAYAYNGEYYESVGKGISFFSELVKRTLTALKVGKVYRMFASRMIADSCMSGLMNSEEYQYKPDRRYITFTNGVFDTEQGKLKAFDMRYVTDIVLDIEYTDLKTLYKTCADKFGISREDNPCKLWEWKIEEIIPNKDMREAFQMFCGTLLVKRDQLKVEYLCYLVGSGSNGKSVAASAIAGVFGERYFARFTPWQLFKASDAAFNMAALQGKIGNFMDDLESKDFSGGDMKRFISGEKFQARRLYKDPILVQAPIMLCCTNSIPESSDDSWGHHRRQLPIYTTKKQWTEADKDPYLTRKLTTPEARQRIFLWIYEGYKKIMRNKGNIVLGDEVVKAQKALQADSNSARRWWRDSPYCIPIDEKNGVWMPLKELMIEYHSYCDEMFETPQRHTDVSAMLRAKGLENKRASGGWMFLVGRKKIENENNE